MDCPKCSIGKLEELIIHFRLLKKNYELTVDQCFTCHGVWFDANELESYLRR
jgi:Zn-finger nucleic acid-binding protein